MDHSALDFNYSFTINNESGGTQHYALFSHAPNIEPTVHDIQSHAILVARDVVSTSGTATFTISRDELYAICGIMHEDGGAKLSVLDRQAVILGSSLSNEGLEDRRGTTCVLRMSPSRTPSFALWRGIGLDQGKPGAFVLKTESFSYKEAKESMYGDVQILMR